MQNERIEHPAYIDLNCFDVDCACESETCKIDNKDDETITTEEGYKFNPFSIDVLEFLNQNADVYQDNIKMETATTPAQTENDNSENENKNNCNMVVYVVKPADTLWCIAKKHKTTIDNIKTLNNLENDNKQQQLEQDKQNDSNDNVSLDNKKIDMSALHEMLKIKENKANITEINERIKITPKFVIITKTKSKVMMNLSVSF